MDAVQAEFREFLQAYPPRIIRQGQTLLYQGEAPSSAYVLKSGVIKGYNISSSGEEKIVTFTLQTEIIPTPWLFEKAPVALFYYDAFTDCEVHSVPKKAILDFMHATPERLDYFMTTYATLYINALMHIHALEQSKASEKLLYTLQYLATRFGGGKTGKVPLSIKLSHLDLARIIGLTRETVAVELNKIKKKGVVSYSKQAYVVDLDKVNAMLGEEEFKSLIVS